MSIKRVKPITPSQRGLIRLNKSLLNKGSLLKKEKIKLNKVSGRDNSGKIISYHRGGGHKKLYRKIDFIMRRNPIGIVSSIEYDPYRNSNIMSVYDFENKDYYYRLQPKYSSVGDIVESGSNVSPMNGNSLPLSKIPVGSYIHNVSLKKNGKSQVSRSAGTYSVLIEKTTNSSKIKMSSGEIKNISSQCYATIGEVSNGKFILTTIGKAGRSRWLNIRPTVRGVAMNPIDHPHGGGEGKTSGGRKSSVTPWGKPSRKGKKKRMAIKR